ncbi:MAG: C1 family peptidase [Bacteroidetes bacterium]|nr:C1 family peptidase [Bacteroidota bacterium]MBU1116378.1 C1 family peptidase [Bacteroidota bacterium]MBU1798658.1 C1 family peptidase [Bacteroidota bacterium]
MKHLFTTLLIITFISSITFSQNNNKASYVEHKSEFFKQMENDLDTFNKKSKEEKKSFKMDFSGIDVPKSVDEFKTFWHNQPVSQGFTGTCWDFSTTSFFESEIFRINGEKIKISEMYTAYWEYVEKAKRFIEKRGDSNFDEGSEGEAVKLNWKRHGAMPIEAYSGLLPEQPNHDHRKLFSEMEAYLKSVKETNSWNEDLNLSTIKSILNHYLGTPPEKFDYNGKTYTPATFFNEVLKLNMDDYIELLSTIKYPYKEYIEFEAPDNWWHSKNYYNIQLDDFMKILKNSVRNGYSVALGGDVSEAGYSSTAEVAMIPSFDIPSEYINAFSREFRISNKTTTDDHGIHIVGYLEKDGKDWYLIKDSGAGSRDGNNKGYYFYEEDYVKLKMLSFMVHKNMLKGYLE